MTGTAGGVQRAPLRQAGLWALLPAMLLLVLAAVAARAVGVPVDYLVHDIAVLGGVAYYAGALSAIGIMVWTAAAAIALFSALALPNASAAHRRMLLGWGGLSALLAADDQFRLHEENLPRFGIPEFSLYALYAVIGVAVLWSSRRVLLRQDLYVLALAGALLGASVGLDVVDSLLPSFMGLQTAWQAYLEDGFKLCGAVVWLFYVGAVARGAVSGVREQAGSATSGAGSAPHVPDRPLAGADSCAAAAAADRCA